MCMHAILYVYHIHTHTLNEIKLQVEKLKNSEIQHVKVDLTKINIKALASQIDVLSDDVKMYMKLVNLNRYYALK